MKRLLSLLILTMLIVSISGSAFADVNPPGGGDPPVPHGSHPIFDYVDETETLYIDYIRATSDTSAAILHQDDIDYSDTSNILALQNFDNAKQVVFLYPFSEIGQYCFYSWENLESVTFADGLLEVGHAAFCYCTSLRSINLPGSVTLIDSWAFKYCYSLRRVNMGNSVTEIGGCAFNSCWNLSDIHLSNRLRKIDEHAFGDTPNLLTISIPYSVINIANYAFDLDSDVSAWYCNYFGVNSCGQGLTTIVFAEGGNPKLTIGTQFVNDSRTALGDPSRTTIIRAYSCGIPTTNASRRVSLTPLQKYANTHGYTIVSIAV